MIIHIIRYANYSFLGCSQRETKLIGKLKENKNYRIFNTKNIRQ